MFVTQIDPLRVLRKKPRVLAQCHFQTFVFVLESTMAGRAPPFRFIPNMNAKDAAVQLLARDWQAVAQLDVHLTGLKNNEDVNRALQYVSLTLPTVPAGKRSKGAREFLAEVMCNLKEGTSCRRDTVASNSSYRSHLTTKWCCVFENFHSQRAKNEVMPST